MRGVVQTWRDAELLNAGRNSGQRMLFMALARANIGSVPLWVRAARNAHHQYIEAAKRAREQS